MLIFCLYRTQPTVVFKLEILCVLDAVCVHVRACVRARACVCVCTCTYVYDTLQTLYTHICTHTRAHTRMHTCMDARTHAHMHAHTHTHTHTRRHNGLVSCKELDRAHTFSLLLARGDERKKLDTPYSTMAAFRGARGAFDPPRWALAPPRLCKVNTSYTLSPPYILETLSLPPPSHIFCIQHWVQYVTFFLNWYTQLIPHRIQYYNYTWMLPQRDQPP